jgi:hypothetical protein
VGEIDKQKFIAFYVEITIILCYEKLLFTVKFGFLNLVVSVRRGNESSESPLVPFPFTGVRLCDLLELTELETDFGDTSNGDDVIGSPEAPPTLKSCCSRLTEITSSLPFLL